MVVIWIIHLQNFSHMYNVTCLIKGDKMDGLIRNQFRARYGSVEWKRAVYYRLLFFLLWLPGYRCATYVSFEHCVPFLPPSHHILQLQSSPLIRWVASTNVRCVFFFFCVCLIHKHFFHPELVGPTNMLLVPPLTVDRVISSLYSYLSYPKRFSYAFFEMLLIHGGPHHLSNMAHMN